MKPLSKQLVEKRESIDDKKYHLRMWKSMVFENMFECIMQRIDNTIDILKEYRTDIINTYVEIYGKMPNIKGE